MCRGKRLAFVLVATLGLSQCGSEPDENSYVNYLTNSSWTCVKHSEQRINEIQEWLGTSFIQGYTGSQNDVAWNHLAGIPNRDLSHLKWRFGRGFSGIKAMMGGGIAGVAYLRSGVTESGFRGRVATSLSTGSHQAAFALQHEVGHGVEIVAREAAVNTSYADFDTSLRTVLNELVSKGSLIRAYAKSKPAESWAESYANYYCSPASKQFIQDNLPTTYKFLQEVLAPPVWENPDQPQNFTPNNIANDGSRETGTATNWSDWLKDFMGGDTTGSTPTPSSDTKPDDNASARATGGTGNPGLSRYSINLALIDPSEHIPEIGLLFASSPEITKVLPCLQSSTVCKLKTKFNADEMKTALVHFNEHSGRNFFNTEFISTKDTDILGSSWTLLGYDENDTLIYSRVVNFRKKN